MPCRRAKKSSTTNSSITSVKRAPAVSDLLPRSWWTNTYSFHLYFAVVVKIILIWTNRLKFDLWAGQPFIIENEWIELFGIHRCTQLEFRTGRFYEYNTGCTAPTEMVTGKRSTGVTYRWKSWAKDPVPHRESDRRAWFPHRLRGCGRIRRLAPTLVSFIKRPAPLLEVSRWWETQGTHTSIITTASTSLLKGCRKMSEWLLLFDQVNIDGVS